jgi:hypothetical protein
MRVIERLFGFQRREVDLHLEVFVSRQVRGLYLRRDLRLGGVEGGGDGRPGFVARVRDDEHDGQGEADDRESDAEQPDQALA